MALVLHNTLSGRQEPLTPLTPDKIGLYVCGVTVYDRCHVGQGLGPSAGRCQQCLRNGHGPVTRHCINGHDRTTLAGRLANALREQRMVFAQKRAHDQHRLQCGQRRNRST